MAAASVFVAPAKAGVHVVIPASEPACLGGANGALPIRPVTAGCVRLPVQGWAPAFEAVKKSDLSGFALAVRTHPVAPDLIRGPSLTVCARRSRSRKDWTAWAGRERPGWAPDQVRGDGVCPGLSPFRTADCRSDFLKSTTGTGDAVDAPSRGRRYEDAVFL